MSLKLKFNIILVFIGIIVILISGFISFNVQRENAKNEALEKASILLESATAVKNYTVSEIRPLISTGSNNSFLPQTIPAFAASRYIHSLQTQHPQYQYKDAVLNPTNPANRASDWEIDIINYFKSNESKRLVGERNTATGNILYLSKPIKVTNGKCLICHSTPEVAPKTMTDRYGTSNGFGWKLNEIIGTQIVSVPLTLTNARADKEFMLFIGTICVTFLIIFAALNILLNKFVLKPVAQMTEHAEKVNTGEIEIPPLNFKSKDEIPSLGYSLNRMHSIPDNSAIKLGNIANKN